MSFHEMKCFYHVFLMWSTRDLYELKCMGGCLEIVHFLRSKMWLCYLLAVVDFTVVVLVGKLVAKT